MPGCTLADDVIARLKERVTDLRTVAPAADLVQLIAANNLPNFTPAAHVVASGLQGGAVESSVGVFRQSVDEQIGVLLSFRNAPGTGARALDSVDTVRAAVIEALCGWGPEGVIGTFRLIRGRVVNMAAGTLVYQIDFAIGDQLRIYPS